jgi:hypothetical protein
MGIVSAHDDGVNLYLSLADNGIGGANAGNGSRLVGPNDRVEALAGKTPITGIRQAAHRWPWRSRAGVMLSTI